MRFRGRAAGRILLEDAVELFAERFAALLFFTHPKLALEVRVIHYRHVLRSFFQL